ncbi:hypothetical protein [Caballeronia sp. GAOx1]|uniref:hypothetical protein n=1 Tax=Caballeronia sp. GAOx1 TaxID=2921761 RepID=UPI002027E1D7|nr:hypothetical protein [Caballeronia sp. GAOx1]
MRDCQPHSAWPGHIAVLALGLACVSCTMPYKTPVYESSQAQPIEEIRFPGIVTDLSQRGELDILLVHGMCTHDEKWAKNAANDLYTSLGGDSQAISLVPSTVPETDVQLFQQTVETNHGKLRINAIVWSRMTTPLKKQLCYDQTQKISVQDNKNAYCVTPDETKSYPFKRDAALNRKLKDSILNDCLADAVIYQGISREEMSTQMQKAILQALATSGKADEKAKTDTPTMIKRLENSNLPDLVVITDSLGSKIAFDALWKLKERSETARATDITIRRISQIFMRANQLPILALADYQIAQKSNGETLKKPGTKKAMPQAQPTAPNYPPDPLGALFSSNKSVAIAQPTIVSFTDPNDLLSYVLASSPNRERMGYSVVDVVTSNARTYFGIIERPDNAHLDYEMNAAVTEAIACGKPKSNRCN